MQKKIIKYTLLILVIGFLVYNSIYFRKLDDIKSAGTSKGFSAGLYARTFYNDLLPDLGRAVEINKLISLLKSSPDTAFKQYSHALDIGNIRYFLVQGTGRISSVTEDAIGVTVTDSISKNDIKIATEFVYGNAIRDASRKVNLNDFNNTADFNNVSEEINKIVRNEVLPAFKTKVREGDEIKFSGAIELNQMYLNLDSIEVIPIQLEIVKKG